MDIVVKSVSLIWDGLFTDKEDQRIQLYTRIFHYGKIFGILPFQFNSKNLTLAPITSGRCYYIFLFNIFYVFASVCKAVYLLFCNWWTNFEEEEFPGGYILQVCYIVGCLLLYSMTLGSSA